MELRHLEYFLAVANELSFTRASQRLHVVQSGVSAAIKTLERELGTPLFDRGSQRVTLTDAGIALLPEARATLAAAQAARDAVDQVRGGLRGAIRVGTMTSIGIVDLPALFGQFHTEHPAVMIRLRAAPSGSAGLAQSLLDGELDIAFLSLPGRAPTGLTVRRLAAVRLVAVLPSDHALAGQSAVTLTSLADEPFIDSPVGYGNRTVADREFTAAGIERHVTVEVADIATVPHYLRHGLGVALLPAFAAPHNDPRLRVLPIAGPELLWSLEIAMSSSHRPSAAVRALLALVDRHLGTPADN
jgi:DNA-binding transcriptional LysR family regulator